MECYTECANNIYKKCTRATAHLLQAKCKDRTVLKEKTKKIASIHCKPLDFKGVVSD